MNILFLNPPFLKNFSRAQRSPAVTKSATIYYPYFLAYAAGYSRKNGHNILLLDCPVDNLDFNGIKKRLNEKGFVPELLVVETSTPSIYNDVEYGVRLKNEFENSKLIIVGTHVSALPRETLELNPDIDFAAIGEYDKTILQIAERLESGTDFQSLKGVAFNKDNNYYIDRDPRIIEDLDEFPFVSSVYKDFLNYKRYFYSANLFPIITILSGRGCPFKCEFCVYPQVFSGHRYRLRSIDNLIEEFQYIVKEFQDVREVFIEDDTLTVYRERIMEFCEKLIKLDLKLKWSTNSRITVDYKTLKTMRRAGCRLLCVGYESGSQEVIDGFNKRIKVKDQMKFSVDAKKAGLMVHGCFLYGYKNETKETMSTTLKQALALKPDTAQFFPIMVYPGTKAYSWAKKKNFLTTENFREWLTPEGLHNCVLSRSDISNKYLVWFCNYSRRRFYLRISYFFRVFKNILKNPIELKRYIKAFLYFLKYLFI